MERVPEHTSHWKQRLKAVPWKGLPWVLLVLALIIIVGLSVTLLFGVQVLQWILLVFFMVPLIEAAMALLGTAWAQFGYAEAPGKFKHLIIQVTTVGKEPQLVQKTVNTIRSYGLTMPYEIWIVIEPGHFTNYTDADEVFVVPADFVCKPVDKARALEYTRRIRKKRGLNHEDVKIIFVDDDTLPSEKYVYKAFNGDYDICQGITVPNRFYAVGGGFKQFFVGGGWRHFVLSHMDNIRTRNCMIYCSCTQGVTQKPLFVHGEGLCITGRTEDIVTWDRPIVASDDLVFGTNAAHMGLSWGYFNAAIQLVSPWTFNENLKQRWRWTWGNFDAIGSRDIMPKASAIFKGFKYSLGFVSVLTSTTGAILLHYGIAKVPPQAHVVFWTSVVCWVISYGVTGWINAGGQPNREVRPVWWKFWGFRVLQTLIAVAMTPITALSPIVVIIWSTLKGRPSRFEMIKKENAIMNLSA